ncbi:MAG: hemerythrin family protein [Rhodospirillaceae bacterium]
MLIEWNPAFETGVEWLDRDHRQVIDLGNQLYELLNDTHTEAMINGLLDQFCSYFSHHLVEEEHIMEMIHYPDLDSHRKDHAHIISVLDRFTSRPVDLMIVDEMSGLLLNWLVVHLSVHESKLAVFIRAGGANRVQSVTDAA